jgi:hypothetical protein
MGKRGDVGEEIPLPPPGRALRSALDWLLSERIFQDLKFHGNTKWEPVPLAAMALAWIWSSRDALTDGFDDAHRWVTRLFGHAPLGTYQGLVGALLKWTPLWIPLLCQRMQQLMEQLSEADWRTGGWLAIAIDGSRGDVPRTRANEARFCAKNFGRGKTAKYRKKKTKGMRRRRNRLAPAHPVKPQVWITLFWHMGLRLPWCWKLGPSDSSERHHVREMLQQQRFPENTLFCGDANFVGYEFWRAIIDAGHDFLMRVGGNAKLLKNLGYVRHRHGLVYCWPASAMRNKQPPLVLRLMKFRSGRKFLYLATTVLSERELSHATAGKLYRQRWGVEVQFRSLKQTFGRKKLRCLNPDRALVEMEWSLLGLTAIQLWALKEQLAAGLSPEQLSVAGAIRAVRQSCEELWDASPRDSLRSRLRRAVIDGYRRTRPKHGRYRPNYKSKPTAGKPQILSATRRHKDILRHHLQLAA